MDGDYFCKKLTAEKMKQLELQRETSRDTPPQKEDSIE